jgi:hypothetical protein
MSADLPTPADLLGQAHGHYQDACNSILRGNEESYRRTACTHLLAAAVALGLAWALRGEAGQG